MDKKFLKKLQVEGENNGATLEESEGGSLRELDALHSEIISEPVHEPR
jgi:hypothetical protein